MLAELLRRDYAFPFGEASIALRYSLSDFLALEQQGISYADIFAEKLTARTIFAFFAVGTVDDIPAEKLGEIIECVGPETIWTHCRAAMKEALPKKDPLIIPDLSEKSGEEFSFFRLRTLIVDIMGKPEEFFWDSTLAELISRWQEYAVAMGYAKPPERVQLYDTEGM